MFKRLLSTMCLLCIGVVCANAQNWVLSGNISGNFSRATMDGADAGKSQSFSVSPGLAYCLSPKWMVGARVGYSYSKATNYTLRMMTDGEGSWLEYTEEGVRKSNVFDVGVFARYYFLHSDHWGIFTQCNAGVGYQSSKSVYSSYPDDELKTKTQAYSIGIAPGVEYFVSSKWSVSVSLTNFIYYNYKIDKTDVNEYKNNVFGLQVNPFSSGLSSLSLGLSYYF